MGKTHIRSLVNGDVGEGVERRLLQRLRLVGPGVRGRADGEVARSVGVREVEGVGDAHRAGVARIRWRDGEAAAEAVERTGGRGRRERPVAVALGHEAHPVAARRRRRSPPTRTTSAADSPRANVAVSSTSTNGFPCAGPSISSSNTPQRSTSVRMRAPRRPARDRVGLVVGARFDRRLFDAHRRPHPLRSLPAPATASSISAGSTRSSPNVVIWPIVR